MLEGKNYTYRIPGIVPVGSTFPHPADGRILYTVTAIPSALNITTRFRMQDESNYWYILVNNTGVISLKRKVAGSTGNMAGSGSPAVSNGDRVEITFLDQTVKAYVNGTLKMTYASATNFKTATNGKLFSLGTGGVMSNLVIKKY
jgi:hypothetical protein